ncbi:hypothetical protein [Lactococcus petauri]|uniref:hypothetical protein n=1 Tax=Lactococcus petauri TaxID=1940789 RepID=UPI00254BCA2F|nr:hypothetical protein [Lactococcus petauri]
MNPRYKVKLTTKSVDMYFIKFDDVHPIFVIDDQPGASDDAHIFNTYNEARRAATVFGGVVVYA